MKKIWTMVLIVCMMLGTSALAAQSNALWVNGINIMVAGSNTVACGNGTAVYDAQKNTLTLNNAQITAGDNDYRRGIDVGNDFSGLNIVLVGVNSIDGGSITQAIYTNKPITISGSGSIDISTKAESILAMDDITIDGAQIKANALNEDYGGYAAINTNGMVSIKNGAKVTAVGFGGTAIGGYLGIEVIDSTLHATHRGNGIGAAISAGNGKVSIENSGVTAIAAANDYSAIECIELDIDGSSEVGVTTGTVGYYGIWTKSGMSISEQAKVNIQSDSASSTGLFNEIDGNIVISDNADVEIDSVWGVWNRGGDIEITSGFVEVNSSSYAFVSKPDLSRYADAVIYAGASKAEAAEAMQSEDYHKMKYVRIQPKEDIMPAPGGDESLGEQELPKTGDASHMALWLLLLGLCGAALPCMKKLRRN